MNEQQLLRDPDKEPAAALIAAGLGPVNSVYTAFTERLEGHNINVDWRYYNDGKAWLAKGLYKWITTRGTEKETNAFWLSVWEGFFKVTFYIPEKHRESALALTLSDQVRQRVENAKQIGKLKFFPVIFDVCSDELFDDIFTLADFRKMLK